MASLSTWFRGEPSVGRRCVAFSAAVATMSSSIYIYLKWRRRRDFGIHDAAVDGDLIVMDCVIVGGGMVGSAAAFHMSEPPACRVALVCGHHSAPSSHDDSSRLVSGVGSYSHAGYAADARLSKERFEEVEKRSGITFYHNSGVLRVVAAEALPPQNGKSGQQDTRSVDKKGVADLVPGMVLDQDFDGEYGGLLDTDRGWMDPRGFVKAHTEAARKNGCLIVDDDVVVRLQRAPAGAIGKQEGVRWVVTTANGKRLACRSVILALGAWTNASGLLPPQCPPLDLQLWAKTLYHLELDAASAEALAGMPTMLVLPKTKNTIKHMVAYTGPKAAPYFYFFPPLQYPVPGGNGAASKESPFWVKIGQSPYDPLIDDVDGTDEAERLKNWFSGKGAVAEDLLSRSRAWYDEKLKALFPKLSWRRGILTTCVTCKTPNGEVYLGGLPDAPGVFVCSGCNGSGAAKANEWGRLLSVQVRCEPHFV